MATKYIGNTKVCEVKNEYVGGKLPLNLGSSNIPNNTAVTEIDFSGCDLSYTTSLASLFISHSYIKKIKFGYQTNFKPTNMRDLFLGANNVISVENLDSIDTSNCTNMASTFQRMRGMTSINIPSTWDTSNCTTFAYMFNQCSSLVSLDISNFVINASANVQNMFGDNGALTTLRVGAGFIQGVNLSSTSLQHDGILQFFNDLPTISDAQTITLGSTKLGYMSDDEKAIAQNKGWTLA